jgi:hypothetical protein
MKYLMTFNIVTLVLLGILSILTSLKFNKNELPWKIIAVYAIGSFICQGVATIYWKLNLNNLTILHIYSLFEFVAFSAFFWSTTQKTSKRKWIFIVSGIVSCLIIVNSIWNEPLRDFNSLGIFISNGTIVVYSVSYFFEVLGADVKTKKYLIVNAGILIFICESLVVFLFGNFLKEVALIDQAVLWYTHISTYIVFLLLILWNYAKLNR